MCPSRQNNEALEASEPRFLQLSGAGPSPSCGGAGVGRRRAWGARGPSPGWGRGGLQGGAAPHEGSPLAK